MYGDNVCIIGNQLVGDITVWMWLSFVLGGCNMYGDIAVWMVGVVFNGQRTVWMIVYGLDGGGRLYGVIPFGWACAIWIGKCRL